MKTLILMLILTTQNVFADPSTEGLQTTISTEELSALRAWTEDTKRDLQYLQSRANVTDGEENKITLYRNELKVIVGRADGINASGMRKVLNRAVHLEHLVDSSQRRGPKGRNFRLALMSRSVQLALIVYQSDIQFIESGAREDNIFIRDQFNFFSNLRRLSTQRSSKINETSLVRIRVAMAGFLNVDIFNSPFRQAAAYEIERINRIVSQENLPSNADLAMLDGLLSNAVRHVPAGQSRGTDSVASVPTIGEASLADCVVSMRRSGMNESYSTAFCQRSNNRNHQKLSCVKKVRGASMNQDYSFNFCKRNASELNISCIQKLRGASMNQDFSYNFCLGSPSRSSVECVQTLRRSGMSQSHTYHNCKNQ